MAPSDDDDAQRVPDAGSSDDAGASELPAGPTPRAIGPRRDDGIDPRPSGSVVFDVEVDDPSLVMQRPSRRARPKPAGDTPIEESEPAAELASASSGGDASQDDDPSGPSTPSGGDVAGDDDEASGSSAESGPPRQLVSGDPLLTGPTPVVRPGGRSSRARPSSAQSEPADAREQNEAADESAASSESSPDATASERRAESTPSGDSSAEEPATSTTGEDDAAEHAASPEETARPPLTAKDLFEPVIREHSRAADIPEPPASAGGPASAAPPPPPAPALAGPGTPAPGVARPTPPPVVPPARRASRGSQVTGQVPTTPVPRADPSGPVAAPRPTAVAPAPRLAGRRPRVRRVTRVVRHVDPWSVFKVAAVFSFVFYGIALVAGVLLWNVAYATGTVDNIERGLESTGWETFELNGGEIFHNAWIGGLFAAVGLTGLAVLVATLFNLITDLVGGVRMTVLEEEVVEKVPSPMRRFSSRRSPEPTPPPQPTRR